MVWYRPLTKGADNGMGMVAVDNLEVGMVLAAPVQDRNGRMLLGDGAELTQKHLVVLRTWGITEVDIAGIDQAEAVSPLPDEIDPDAVAAAEQSLLPLFKHAGTDHPALKELLRVAAIRKVQHGLC